MNFWLLAFFLAIGFFHGKWYRKPKYELHVGEEIVNNAILNTFKNDCVLLTNLTLPVGRDQTTQIDHVLLTRKGIFVIETKHYAGQIAGDEESTHWTQITSRHREFQNPLVQNEGHIKAMKALLPNTPAKAFVNLVIFSGSGTFRYSMPFNVIHVDKVHDFLMTFKDDVLSDDDLRHIIGALQWCRYHESPETDALHLANIKRKHG